MATSPARSAATGSTVVSIMNNPDQDPHLFETTPGIVRQIAGAQIVIYQRRRLRPLDGEAAERGAAAGPHGHRRRRPGRAKRPATIRISGTIPPPCRRSPRRSPRRSARPIPPTPPTTRRGSRRSLASLKPLNDKIAAIRGKYAGAAGHRHRAGVRLHGRRARADRCATSASSSSIMNDTEPSARDVAAFEHDLKDHKVRRLFYNRQASDKIVQRLRRARARRQDAGGRRDRNRAAGHVATRTGCWAQLDDTEKALAGPSS